MPKELEGVAGLCPIGKASAPPKQLCFFQLGKVLLGLAHTDANLQSQVAHGGETPAILSGVSRQSPLGHLCPRRHQLRADQRFRDEDACKEAIGIEGLANHKRSWSLTVVWLSHDFP